MARFTATFTMTEATNREQGDFLRTDKFRDEIGQNIEWLAQSHDHSGDAGDGGTIAISDPKQVWWWATPPGSPFA